MSEIAIRVENLGKLYHIGQRERYKALRDTLTDAMYAPFRRLLSLVYRASSDGDERRILRQGSGQATSDNYIWALKDVSFAVKRGEVVGIIGRNGAGKSTLLRILSRITEPTEGYAGIHGRVGSLLEVGTGFHPELTGRENIYLNGAILGMKKVEIERKFDEIVAFSGVEKFIDTPMKRYSSGMYVRLAFAIAAHLDPEILLVDEVLAVGDAAFQEKCLGRMSKIASSGRTVLFISHNMAAVRSLCSRALLLERGQIQYQGTVDAVVQAYLVDGSNSEQSGHTTIAGRQDESGSRSVRAVSFQVRSCSGEQVTPSTGSDTEFIVAYAVSGGRPIIRLHVVFTVMDTHGVNVFTCTTAMTGQDFRDVPPSGQVLCRIRSLPLIPGRYWVNVMLKDDKGLADQVNRAAAFNVVDGGTSGFFAMPSQRLGIVVVPHDWEWLPAVDQAGINRCNVG